MDEAKFRAAAKAEGYTDEQINAHLGKNKPKSFIESKKAETEQKFQQNEKDKSTEVMGAAVPNNLLLPAAVGLGGAAAGMAYKGMKGSSTHNQRVDPVLDTTPFREPAFDVAPNSTPAGPTPAQIAEQTRIAKQQQAFGQINNPQPAPQVPEVQQAPQTPNVLQEKLASIQAAQQPAPPVIKAPDAPPTVNELQVNPATSAIDEAGNLKVPEILQQKEVAGDLPTVKKKGAPTLSERAAKVAEFENLAKNAPEGMIPNKFPNKVGQEVIGRGGYNHAYALFGEETPERWMEKYGPKNVPYETVRDDISAARRPMPATATGVESVNARPKYVPEFIKGHIAKDLLKAIAPSPVNAAQMLGLFHSSAGEGSTLIPTPPNAGRGYDGAGAGRGFVNPPDVDPNTTSGANKAIAEFFQRLMGDKTPYNHFGLENRIDPTRTNKQYKIQSGK